MLIFSKGECVKSNIVCVWLTDSIGGRTVYGTMCDSCLDCMNVLPAVREI